METSVSVRKALQRIVGDEFVSVTDISDGGLWSWQPAHVKNPRPPAPLVVSPADADQVAQVVRLALWNAWKLVAVGGKTNVRGLPDANIAVDLSRLQKIEWDERSLTVAVGAGVRIDALEERLEGHGYTTGQRLRSGQLATVGGCVATDAVGLLSGRYGRFRDIVVALQCVRADGILSGGHPLVRGDGVGAFGHEGSLGIVTEATLAIRPVPDARAWAIFDFSKRDDLIDAMRLVLRSDSRPAIARTIDGAVAGSFRLLLGFEGDELVQTGHYQMAFAICQKLGGQSVDTNVGDDWLATADRCDIWAKNSKEGVYSDALAVFVSWTNLGSMLDALDSAFDGRPEGLAWTLCHPTPHGVAVECELTIRGSRADWERAIGLAWFVATNHDGRVHHFGAGAMLPGHIDDSFLKSALDPTGVFPSWR